MSSLIEQVGRVVGGRYRLLAPIGAGASSQVFAAVDDRLGRRVAVKVLHPALEGDETFLRLFRAEARFAASLDHPHVMRVFDWGEETGGPYLVLELLPGGSLRGLLDKARLSHAQVATVGRQAAAGLAYAHRRGIIHRDIKPGNLLFDDEGHLRIGDFGVARAIAGAASTEPLGSMFGTARYASPEQATGASLDERTDVYSLALVLYEALTGRVPFSGDTVSATLAARVGATLPPARELGPLAPILAAAAIPEPLARLDAAGLAQELEQLERQLPPGDPLPLARLELGPRLAAIADRDPTDLDPGHPSARATLPLSRAAEATSVAAAVPPPPGPPATKRPAGSGRRRLAFFLGALVLVGLLAAGAALAVIHFEIYGHVVPDVVGYPVTTARAVLVNDDLRLRVVASRYDAHEPRGAVISESPRPGTREKADSIERAVVSKGPAPVAVPDVTGAAVGKAESALRAGRLGYVVQREYSETVPAGVVVTQVPLAAQGKRLPGTKVTLYVSKGPAPVAVPGVEGQPLATAEQDLRDVQLSYVEAKSQYSTTVPQGDVISESPSPKTLVKRGSAVTLVVSLGEPYVTVPDMRGHSLASAEAELRSLGLGWTVYGPSFGAVVIDSEPGSGASIREGQTVDLYVI